MNVLQTTGPKRDAGPAQAAQVGVLIQSDGTFVRVVTGKVP